MNWNKWIAACMPFAAAAVCLPASAAQSAIAVSINAEKRIFGTADDVVVEVTLTNMSRDPQYVLKWHTPFNQIEEDLFEVTRDGEKVAYLGYHAKRPAPKPGDYFVLKPGKSYSRKVELSALYDMSVTGNYAIRYQTASLHLFSPGIAESAGSLQGTPIGMMRSDQLVLTLHGRLASSAEAVPPAQPWQSAGLSYSRCSRSQASTVSSAFEAARSMTNSSVSYLSAGRTGSRYTTWFGSYSWTRYNTVRAHFNAIRDAIYNKPVVVDCGCTQPYYAYVYPTRPYKIYVCRAFWSAPMTGTDSKGGTLVHELSHFNVVAGTEDWAYGQWAAKRLASSDPDRAVDNADSHEYFAENTPYLY
jgi:peptidyl-Lys metalloendopeptidase